MQRASHSVLNRCLRLQPLRLLIAVTAGSLSAGPQTVLAEAGAVVSPTQMGSSLGASPEATAVIFKIFSDKEGENLARLRIERVKLESQREGFLRLGFRPLVVFEGVTLDINPGAIWPEAGDKITQALRHQGRGNFLLRNIRLQINGTTPCQVWAPLARLRADGALELSRAVVHDAKPALGPTTLCFWLTGPRAGELVADIVPRAFTRKPDAVEHKSSRLD